MGSVAPIVDGQRLDPLGAVGGEIVGVQRRPLAQSRTERLGDVALVEATGPLVGDGRQRRGEIGLFEPVAGRRRSPVQEERRRRPVVGREFVPVPAHPAGEGRRHRDAILGQSDGVLEQARPRQFAVSLVGESPAVDGAGDGECRARAPLRYLAFGRVERSVGVGRRGATGVDTPNVAVGWGDEPEAVAADPGHVGVGDGEDGVDADSGVDGTAAGPEDVEACAAGEGVGRCDHGVWRARGRPPGLGGFVHSLERRGTG